MSAKALLKLYPVNKLKSYKQVQPHNIRSVRYWHRWNLQDTGFQKNCIWPFWTNGNNLSSWQTDNELIFN